MAKKEKEEDRIERIIRGLLKLPDNRRCINCNCLGPQYVCTTFLTFVCTNCSGVHREFTHRVKSVSMAKFSADEVSALQAGGNERARQLYFKDWDPQRNSYPDGSNLHKLRDFIKHVYVDRRYSGERSQDRVSRPRMGEREEFPDSRKVGPYRDGSRSPTYEERSRPGGRSEERVVKYYYDERRSPRHSQDTSRSGGMKKTPVRFEVVDDRVRSGRDTRLRSLPPNSQKTVDYPAVRSIKDILGDDVPSLRIGENSKTKDTKDAVTSAQEKVIASSSSKESVSVQAVEEKVPHSLIDFSSDSMPSDAVVASGTSENHQSGGNNESSSKQDAPPGPKPNTLEFLLLELSVPSVESSGCVSAMSNNVNPPPTPSGDNMLTTSDASAVAPLGQLLTLPDNAGISTNIPEGNMPTAGVPLAQWLNVPDNAGVSHSTPGGNMSSDSPTGQILALPSSFDASANVSGATGNVTTTSAGDQTSLLLDPETCLASSEPLQPSNEGAPQTVIDIDSDSPCKIPNGQAVSFMQQHQFSAFPDTASGLHTSATNVGAQNNQPWSSLHMPDPQGPASASAELPSQVVTIFEGSDSGINSQHLPVDSKSSERKELPLDLFAASYSPVPGAMPGWRNTLPYGTAYSMQYHPNAVPTQSYSNHANSSNPFDLNNDSTSIEVSPFQSMGNLQAALPNMSAPRAVLPNASNGANPSGLMAAQGPYSYGSAMPLQTSSFASVAPSDTYMGQQLHMNTPYLRAQGPSVGSGSNAFFGSVNMSEPSPRGYQLPSPSNSYPSTGGGNPFG
ncbi:ArfGap/RecO-like zinc finger domain-containing protein [Euphorbia peplus]|nr:ArfGap/RecO-like zinc finger domain-containing protein [Euphorbia peplus]